MFEDNPFVDEDRLDRSEIITKFYCSDLMANITVSMIEAEGNEVTLGVVVSVPNKDLILDSYTLKFTVSKEHPLEKIVRTLEATIVDAHMVYNSEIARSVEVTKH